MKIDQLRYFVEVAKVHSIGIAAENLFVTAPAVSIAIKSLEKELNCSLLDRNKNDISLTPVGQEILAKAEAMLAMEKQIYSVADDFQKKLNENLSGNLKLVSVPMITHSFLNNAVVSFFQKNQSVRIQMDDAMTENILEIIQQGNSDIGFSIMSKEDFKIASERQELEVKKLFKEKVFLVAHRHYILPSRQAIHTEEIKRYPIVAFVPVSLDAYSDPEQNVEDDRRPAFSTRSFDICRKLVISGNAMAVVTSSMASAFNNVEDIDVIPISDIDSCYIVYFYRKDSDNRKIIEAFESEVLRNTI